MCLGIACILFACESDMEKMKKYEWKHIEGCYISGLINFQREDSKFELKHDSIFVYGSFEGLCELEGNQLKIKCKDNLGDGVYAILEEVAPPW